MISIYTIPKCDGCRHAIALCKFKNIPHVVIELTNKNEVEKLRVMLGNNRNIRVPLALDEDGKYIGHLPELKKWISEL
jgi:glutaredoxin